jgi:hypothetical protein
MGDRGRAGDYAGPAFDAALVGILSAASTARRDVWACERLVPRFRFADRQGVSGDLLESAYIRYLGILLIAESPRCALSADNGEGPSILTV